MSQAAMLYDAQKKSLFVAYLFWFFFSSLGAHRFYLKRTRSAVIMLCLTILGVLTSFLGVGALLLGVVAIWSLVDAFLIPGMARAYNTKLAYDLGAGEDPAGFRIG